MKLVMAMATVAAVLFLTAIPMAHAQLSGDWEGATDQGYPVYFTVVNNVITTFSFGFNLACWDHKSVAVGLGFAGLPVPIAPDGRFSFQYTGFHSSFRMEGIFASSVAVKGSAGSNWAALWPIKQSEAVQKCLSGDREWTASVVPPSAVQSQDLSAFADDYDYFMKVTNGPDGESFSVSDRGTQGD